jgi:hypothetical protein
MAELVFEVVQEGVNLEVSHTKIGGPMPDSLSVLEARRAELLRLIDR